ncbi:MAG TPA: hypothetical protein VIP48_12675 [Streptosporangiaceae bacterium]
MSRALTAARACAALTALTALTATAVPTAAQAAAPGSAASPSRRGQLVSAVHLRTLPNRAAVRAELTADGFDPRPARYGVRTYRLVYRTVNAAGRPTTASGLLAVPVGLRGRLPVVSFTHGTEVYRRDAPSMQPHGFEPGPAYTYASAGFAVADPDYLGLGTGPGVQPWMDVPAETTAALDMLRAARGYLSRHGHPLSRPVMVTGFSPGASAALGLGRALQGGADHWFRLGALAPISGAYEFRRAELPALLRGELVRLNPNPRLGAKYSVLYTALTLVSFDRVHRIYRAPAAVFRPPYARTISKLLDGNHPDQQILNGTPARLGQLLTARGFALLRHPTAQFAAELAATDSVCTDWTPAAPTRLYYATRDEQAVTANTIGCQHGFAAHGRPVPAINLGTPDNQGSRHYGSNVAGTARIVGWFSRLARGR